MSMVRHIKLQPQSRLVSKTLFCINYHLGSFVVRCYTGVGLGFNYIHGMHAKFASTLSKSIQSQRHLLHVQTHTHMHRVTHTLCVHACTALY